VTAEDARLTRGLGGNLLRIFWSVESVVVGPPEDYVLALNSVTRGDLQHRAVFLEGLHERVERLDRCNVILDQLLLAVADRPDAALRLDFSALDALFDGIDDANRDSAEPVQVVLALVSAPPRWIIEAPSDVTLARMSRGYSFASLWDRYVRFHADAYRRLVRRYAVERPTTGLRALEIFNEPDYNWIPEEVKIEGATESLVNPLGKYVTELMLPQVPVSDRGYVAFETPPWCPQPQDAAWTEHDRPPVGVLDFDWGPKFDWYVRCAAQLQTHCARAIKDEAARYGADLVTVSGSVTHNNIDYLLRMHREDHATFAHIDRIGLHPYHWRDNDVWNDRFVSSEPLTGWPQASPRAFAAGQFKRFDFLRAFRANSGDAGVDAEIRAAFGDRKLWITEFGIGSKVLEGYNALEPERNRFIRPRAMVGASGGESDVVWEDLWQAFLDQVGPAWLREAGVECVLLYGLRELELPGFDLDDKDRSNLALLHRDGTPRIDQRELIRIGELMSGLSGRPCVPAVVPTGRPDPVLYRRPWRSVELSDRAREVTTMLSLEERRLLFWLTSQYHTGAGAIVDGGCFVGGSTIPLAEGLRASGRAGIVDVYDRFEVEPYMAESYFKAESLASGESFRPVFDRYTDHVADLLRVHEGDLAKTGWRGDPIEILFVDFAKGWGLNDFVVSDFFPALIPGRSLVVQQDFVFAWCPWVALTMEHLADYFEPVAFAEYCSVVFACVRQVPSDVEPVSTLPHEQRMQLMDRAIGRFRGYPRDVLACAKAALLFEHGDREAGDAILAAVEGESEPHHAVAAAVDLVATLR
jgi:hypothetical protein